MRKAVMIGASALLAAAAPALAQGTRYQIERTEHGVVRLDAQTGELSACRDEGGQLVCQPASDERTAYQDEVEALRQRVEELDRRVAALEAFGPPRPSLDVPGDTGLPSEEEFERSLGFMEKFFRRFMGIIREFENEEAERGQPDRT